MATILITTTDLEQAVRLRAAFDPDDRVELVTSAQDARSGLSANTDGDIALILTGSTGDPLAQDVIAALAEDHAPLATVAVLGEGQAVPDGLSAGLGPDEYFVQPVDADEVAFGVRRLIAHKQLQNELGIAGKAEAIQEVIERIAQIAPVGSTVLITGESGTGKELVARGLQKLSPRRGKPFIAVNIGALPETLLESELFGHEKGAFTGASSLRKGMFELAKGGTIFLDEVAEMPLSAQTRLLRVLEQREFMRVGGSETIQIDVRVIAATNRDLRRAVELNEFRRDLYYRLNVLNIHMPALRERREDVPLLVHEFIRGFSRDHDKQFRGIAPEAMRILQDYDWPGNVRELRNLVESMVVLAPGSVIGPEDIPPEVLQPTGRALVPSPVRAPSPGTTGRTAAPPIREMEFIFRTLVELKLDVEDLRREFEVYKRRHPELVRPWPTGIPAVQVGAESDSAQRPREVIPTPGQPARTVQAAGSEPAEEETVIRFRPGETLQELERAAIVATLKEVGGNRRLASDKLGIGERTLYRKLKEYSIDT